MKLFRCFLTLFLMTAVFQTGAEQKKTKGYNCVLMGHSFFCPVARGFDKIAKAAGFTEHKQHVAMMGGQRGTPGWFWETESHKSKIQSYIKSNKVDMVGMTYHPEGKVKLEDYKRWVDFAVKHNPATSFFIAMPWGRSPQKRKFDNYKKDWQEYQATIDKLINGLKKAYPKNNFFTIPYGKGVYKLHMLFNEGKVPDAKKLVSRKDGLFKDSLGHANQQVLDLSRLVWLAFIYKKDVSQLKWDGGYKTDLKSIVTEIVKEEAQ